MDEHVSVSGECIKFDAPFADENLRDLAHFTTKHNAYATREAVQVLIDEIGPARADAGQGESNIPAQAAAKRRFRKSVYDRLPFGFAPTLYFLWRYFVRGGFLDGREGAIYHVLQGFWYRFLVESRKVELRRSIRGLPAEAIADRLAQVTGLDLTTSTVLNSTSPHSLNPRNQ